MAEPARIFSVLIVDDSELACEVVQATLTPAGIHVTTLSSPFGFSNLVRKVRPHLILLDIGMPALTGTKLVELGRTHGRPGCRIILYSDRVEAELARETRDCHADGYISKSVRGAAFVAVIRDQLARLPR